MLDLVLRNGVVVDGTRRAGEPGSVGVRDGRVVSVGEVDEPARRTIDVEGRVIAPGFIDLHTHFDAQVFWDGTLSPSPLHGVTTVVGGNCGFSIAPLDERDADYAMRMLARVEGMPLEALQEGVPWDWRTTAEYLDRLEGRLAPNAGFLVGHSALRIAVMHEDAVGHDATPEQLESMRRLLDDGLRAGGLGFSSTWSPSHNDHHGDPVPSRAASTEEMRLLCEEAGRHPGTTLEFIPGIAPYDEDLFEIMLLMSSSANRPLNWNVLQVNSSNRDVVDHQLSVSDRGPARGARILALVAADTIRSRLNMHSGFGLDVLNGWDRLMALPPSEKMAMLRDPDQRAEMQRLALVGPNAGRADWSRYQLVETFTPEYERYVGSLIGDIAAERGTSPWDTLADMNLADELRTVIMLEDRGQDDESWKVRVDAWRDPRTIIGASDAGAHLDMIDSFASSTRVLGEAVRRRQLLPIEEAIALITDDPARLYGLRDRGRLVPGYWADITVLDPDTVGCGPVHTRYDLPRGAGRLYATAEGIEHVFVAGTEVVSAAELTDERPGAVLRSGRDTETVTAR